MIAISENMVPRIMKKYFYSVVSSILMTCSASAGESAGTGGTISLSVPLVCKAEISSLDSVGDTTRVGIRELCNGGAGYDLELLHDGVHVERMTYDDTPVSYDGSTQTVIASRGGAYHGYRTLVIETAGQTPRIYGVRVKRQGSSL